MKPEVSAEIEKRSAEGNGLCEEGRYKDAIAKWGQALRLIPDPKTRWKASTWLYTSLGDAYFQLQQFGECRAACMDALNCPDGVGNPFIHLRLGQACLELGDEVRAADELARAYMGGGKELFDEDSEYWQFITSKLKPPASGEW